MIIPIPSLDLSTLTTSSKPALVTLNQTAPYFSLDQEQRKPYWLVFHNESGSLLQINLSTSGGKGFRLPAGAWRILTLLDYVDSFTVQVLNVLPNPPIQQLLVDFYSSDEVAPTGETLGNSPIGLSATTLPVTQVLQDSQPSGQTIVESTPTSSVQTILMTTDGELQLIKVGTGANSNMLRLRQTAGGGSVARDFFFIVNVNGKLVMFDNTGGLNMLVGDGTGIAIAPLTQVGSQASVGSFGVPVIVAQALRTLVTVTTQVTILSFSIPANGSYRVSPVLRIGNTTANNKPIFQMSYTGPTGATETNWFAAIDSSTPATMHAMDGSSAIFQASWGAVITAPTTIDANVGTLTIRYTAAGTPSDTVSLVVERLA